FTVTRLQASMRTPMTGFWEESRGCQFGRSVSRRRRPHTTVGEGSVSELRYFLSSITSDIDLPIVLAIWLMVFNSLSMTSVDFVCWLRFRSRYSTFDAISLKSMGLGVWAPGLPSLLSESVEDSSPEPMNQGNARDCNEW